MTKTASDNFLASKTLFDDDGVSNVSVHHDECLYGKGFQNQKGLCADLLHFAGTWDQNTTKQVDMALKEQRQIDKKMWKS